MIFRRQRLPHAEGHEQLLSHLLLAKGDGSAGHHDTFSALEMAFCDLLKNSLHNKVRFLLQLIIRSMSIDRGLKYSVALWT